MSYPGPLELGRGIVIAPGAPLDSHWDGVERVRVAEVSQICLAHLHRAWVERRRVVVELALSVAELRQPERESSDPYLLKPDFGFLREQLHFLVWANNYDATRGQPVWWYQRLAQRLGARPHPEADIDHHGPVWVDGGPRTNLPFAVVHRESIDLGRLTLTLPEHAPTLELAPDQLRAVLHRGGAACVLAPAGSGKTRVLTQRLAHLLHCGVEPQRITALAYNRRAALEMRQRLPQAQQCLRTLHALGFALLRQHKNLRLANEREIRGLLGRLVKAPALLNQDPLQPYLDGLQLIRLGLLDPHEVEAGLPDVPGLAEAFPRYRALMAERGWLDHDEQIYGALELLLQDSEVRKQAQKGCTHLLVDEFQDLTPAFVLLVRLLSAPRYQLFGVGDDDQVIYGYAGASPRFLVDFKDYFPSPTRYTLEVNYRCPPGIVEAVGHLLRHNRVRVPKDTRTLSTRQGGSPELILAPAGEAGQRALAQVDQWLQRVGPEKVAVLSRVNALLMPVQVLFRQRGIPHNATVDITILQRTGMRTALAYLRLAQGIYSSADLGDALRRPNRMLKRELVEQASRCRTFDHLCQWSARQDPWPASQLDDFLGDLNLLQKRLKQGLAAFFRALRLETDFPQALEQLDSSGLGAAGGSSHRDDLVALEQTALAYGLADPSGFEVWLETSLSGGEQEGGVRLSSVHRVKGLEWPYVLMYGADQGILPHRLSDDLEEERRIFHVALTRAQEHCVIVADPALMSPF
ncbi:ATP-dependent helicase, partial [bacterium]|nr:ATP-dependent helicase [bacterium]